MSGILDRLGAVILWAGVIGAGLAFPAAVIGNLSGLTSF
jgi:hypothetical protein